MTLDFKKPNDPVHAIELTEQRTKEQAVQGAFKMDIRDVSGKPLDWLVALCLTTKVPKEQLTSFTDGMVLCPEALVNFAPSTRWEDAKWVIEKYGIDVSYHPSSRQSGWQDYSAVRGAHHLIGHDATTAAMRCFVASFMGLAVEIPADVMAALHTDPQKGFRQMKMTQTNLEASRVMLQVLEAIRATNPELIADNLPAGWGMNKLREALVRQRRDIAEYEAVLEDPIGLIALMNYHDLQQTRKDASDMPGGEFNHARREELKEMGRQLILKENDFAIFTDDVLRDFGFAGEISLRQQLEATSTENSLGVKSSDAERIAALEFAVGQLIPCTEAAEICLRADGLNAAADKCISALDVSRPLVHSYVYTYPHTAVSKSANQDRGPNQNAPHIVHKSDMGFHLKFQNPIDHTNFEQACQVAIEMAKQSPSESIIFHALGIDVAVTSTCNTLSEHEKWSQTLEHLQNYTPFLFNNKNKGIQVADGETGETLPRDWVGVCSNAGSPREGLQRCFRYIGQSYGERSYNVLKATNYIDACKEAEPLRFRQLKEVGALAADWKPNPEATEGFAGYIKLGDNRVQVDFELAVGASQADKDAGFLAALEQVAEIDYLSLGVSNGQQKMPEPKVKKSKSMGCGL